MLHSQLDALIHMYASLSHSIVHADRRSDAQDLHYVYEWRQEQERTLRAAKGTGMTEEQVNHFVDGCMSPAQLYIYIIGIRKLTNQTTRPTNCSPRP